MKVICIGTTGLDVSQRLIDLRGALRTSDYGLTLGNIYPVYGIMLWKYTLAYLIPIPQLEEGDPYWFPVELFQVVDHLLPKNWYFKDFGENPDNGVNAIWGFKELAMVDRYHERLSLHNRSALKIYYQRRREIDEELLNINSDKTCKFEVFHASSNLET